MYAWGCVQTDGTAVWDTNATVGIDVVELAVDPFGRPWFIGNDQNGVSPPLLVVTASDGSTYETFTYGASMNDLAMGDDHAYITGAIPVGAPYLIAVGTDLTTEVSTPVKREVGIYPQPANSQITVSNAGRIAGLRISDATGKQVFVPTLAGNTLDVSKLIEGLYFLEANTATGPITRRFVVTH